MKLRSKIYRVFVVIALGFMTQMESIAQVKWVSFEQGVALAKSTKKKIMVDMYTDWCGWCKHMEKTTFQSPVVARIITDYFIPVKFDAEQKANISFNGKTYKYVQQGNRGYHQLAVELSRDQLSFPTIVFLDENAEMIQPLPGYQDAHSFEMVLSYFARNYHKSTPWSSYQRTYQPLKPENISVPVRW